MEGESILSLLFVPRRKRGMEIFMTPEKVLKQYFGYDSFRPGQEDLITALLSGQDVLINRFLIEHKSNDDLAPEDAASVQERDHKRLWQMENYCTQTGCLRNYILRRPVNQSDLSPPVVY